MNTLEKRINDAIELGSEFWEFEYHSALKESTAACTTITIDELKKFAEWLSKKGYYQINASSSEFHNLWFMLPSVEEDMGVTTDELINTYIDTIKP